MLNKVTILERVESVVNEYLNCNQPILFHNGVLVCEKPLLEGDEILFDDEDYTILLDLGVRDLFQGITDVVLARYELKKGMM